MRGLWCMGKRSACAAGVTVLLVVGVLAGCRKELSGVEKAREAVARNPASAKAYLELGRALCAQKSYNDAYASFIEARKLAPQDPDVAYELALVCYHLADSERGLRAAREAVSLNPRSARAHEILGRHLLLTGQQPAALQEFGAALALDRANAEAYLGIIRAHEELGDKAAALRAAGDGVRAVPNSAALHFKYANLLVNEQQLELGEKHYREAIRLDRRHAAAMLQLAILLVNQGRNYEEARGLAKQAAEINPFDGTAAATAAWALFKLGKATDALRELYQTCNSYPYNAQNWLVFARALREEGYEDRAELALKIASQVAPRVPLTPQQRAALTRLRQRKGAKSDQVLNLTDEDLRSAGIPETVLSPPDAGRKASEPPQSATRNALP